MKRTEYGRLLTEEEIDSAVRWHRKRIEELEAEKERRK